MESILYKSYRAWSPCVLYTVYTTTHSTQLIHSESGVQGDVLVTHLCVGGRQGREFGSRVRFRVSFLSKCRSLAPPTVRSLPYYDMFSRDIVDPQVSP